MIEPYEVYKLYLAIKLHFTTKSYDVVTVSYTHLTLPTILLV